MQPGDVLLMTEGAGGGTIATAAIYSGYPDVVEQTINLQFLMACETLMKSEVFSQIHAMTDVTNGGLRGDAFEMAETAQCRIVIDEKATSELVEPRVKEMLEDLKIDYLGVSIDSLLVVAPSDSATEIRRVVEAGGVVMREMGRVEKGAPESVLYRDGREHDFSPRFRESAYTPVKKVIDTRVGDVEEMKKKVLHASEAAIQKKQRVLSNLLRTMKNAAT